MKAETKKALDELKRHLEWKEKGQGACLDNIDDISILIKLFNELPVMESHLANGGLVRDFYDKWLANGDSVIFWIKGTDMDNPMNGTLVYDKELMQWFVRDESGWSYELKYCDFISK